MNKLKLCRYCKTKQPLDDGIQTPLAWFCSVDHAFKYTSDKQEQARLREKARQVKENRKKRRDDKERIKTRSEWYAQLQKLVNQWVKIRDINEPCCTCGTTNDVKYDSGHFFTVGARPDIRFDLRNIHKQCSTKCNVYGSGMRAEYKEFIIRKYGQDVLDDLTLEKESLKVQFPHFEDIKTEILRYRKMIREAGYRPNS